METTINQTTTGSITETAVSNESAVWEKIEYNRFGLSVGVLAVVGCMGGVAAAYAGGLGMAFVLGVAWASGIALAMALAVGPMRVMLAAAGIALAVNILTIFVSVIS